MIKALEDIANERDRQITKEGWTAKHDDEHTHGELAASASAYAWLASLPQDEREEQIRRQSYYKRGVFAVIHALWPVDWADYWFKPTTPRRDLVKAGALIIAEIERLDREDERKNNVRQNPELETA